MTSLSKTNSAGDDTFHRRIHREYDPLDQLSNSIAPLKPPTAISFRRRRGNGSIAVSSILPSFASYLTLAVSRLPVSPSTNALLCFSANDYFLLRKTSLLFLLHVLYYKCLYVHRRAHWRQRSNGVSTKSGARTAVAKDHIVSCPLDTYTFQQFYDDFSSFASAATNVYCTIPQSLLSLFIAANAPTANTTMTDDMHIIDTLHTFHSQLNHYNWKSLLSTHLIPLFIHFAAAAECPLPQMKRGNSIGTAISRQQSDGGGPAATTEPLSITGRKPFTGSGWNKLRQRYRSLRLMKQLRVQREFAMLWQKHLILNPQHKDDDKDEQEDGDDECKDDGEDGSIDDDDDSNNSDDKVVAAGSDVESDICVEQDESNLLHDNVRVPMRMTVNDNVTEPSHDRLTVSMLHQCSKAMANKDKMQTPPQQLSATRTADVQLMPDTAHLHVSQSMNNITDGDTHHHSHNKHVHRSPHQVRAPLCVFIGGGMGGGKSTVLAHLRDTHRGLFGLSDDAVLIEADHFKAVDPVYNALPVNDPDRAELVHNHSIQVAEEALLAAIRARRDVVIDGTMSWAPYVSQTIDMIRNSHKTLYERGPGYQGKDKEERYWTECGQVNYNELQHETISQLHVKHHSNKPLSDQTNDDEQNRPASSLSTTPPHIRSDTTSNGDMSTHSSPVSTPSHSLILTPPMSSITTHLNTSSIPTRLALSYSTSHLDATMHQFLPYRIAMLGVTVPATFAVSRALRRAAISGRTVPLNSLLNSYKLFSTNYHIYITIVDAFEIYENGADEMQYLPSLTPSASEPVLHGQRRSRQSTDNVATHMPHSLYRRTQTQAPTAADDHNGTLGETMLLGRLSSEPPYIERRPVLPDTHPTLITSKQFGGEIIIHDHHVFERFIAQANINVDAILNGDTLKTEYTNIIDDTDSSLWLMSYRLQLILRRCSDDDDDMTDAEEAFDDDVTDDDATSASIAQAALQSHMHKMHC